MRQGRNEFASVFAALRTSLGNPVSRIVLRSMTRPAPDGRPVLDKALARYAGLDVPVRASCRFESLILDLLLKMGALMTGGSEEKLKEMLRDPAVRRGIELVLKGIGYYGITVPQKLPAPFLIVWNFTNMCNLRCRHCYQRADRPLPDELSLAEKLRVVEELDSAGVAAIAFSGGEPTIHPDFLRVASEASRRGLYVAVATNGTTLANPEFAEKMKRAGIRYVEVSIDSAKPERHDWFRGVQGAWRRAVKGLRNAVKLGFSTAMATTLTKLNVDEIDELVDLAEDIGVDRIIFFNFVPVGRGTGILHLDLDPLEREHVLRELFKQNGRRRVVVASTAPQFGRISLQLSGGEEVAPTHFYVGGDPGIEALADFVGGCGAGRIYAGIQPNGDVVPCVFLPIVVGSLRRQSFWEIWTGSPVLRDLRDRERLRGFCGKCPYRYVCGGCRARAYAYTGDILGPDPGCLYNLKTWRKIAEEIKGGHEAPSLSVAPAHRVEA